MTLPNVENQNPEGAGENGKSIAGAPSSSQELLELKRDLELTRKELKGLQSRSDKDKNEVQRFMEEVKAQVAKGLSIEDAENAVYASRESERDKQLLNKIAQKLGIDDSLPNVAGNNNQATNEAEQVFAEYNINPNDPEAIALLSLQGAELIKAVSKLAIKRASNKTADSSEAPSLSGNPPPPSGVKELTEKYQKDILATPRGKAGDALRKQLKEQARKNGVPVDSIAFV